MRLIQIIILLLISGCMHAQDVEFTATASPNVVRTGEQFNLIFSSNQELEELKLPEINDFELLGGPSQGHSQSVYSANGKITTTSTWQYTYFFRASKEGKFTIPAAVVKIKNKTYQSNTVSIEVVKQPAQSGSQNVSASGNNPARPGEFDENDLFVRLILDKREAYVGEQILATVKIYTKTELSGINQAFKGPDFTGFFTEQIETPRLSSLQREVVNGDIYYTGVVRRLLIIPQKTGELTIEPFELEVAIRREVRRRISDPYFEDLVIPDIQEIPAKLKSNPVKVIVRSLPQNSPPSFKGAVGNFKLIAALNRTVTSTHDPLTLKLTVSGKGNLKLINEVEVKVPYDMDRYDPVINTRFDSPLAGSKTFEYLIVPKVAGQFTIPPVEFTYFDPDDNKYKTLKSQSFEIVVEKGQGDTLSAAIPGMRKEDVQLLNQDIRFIKTQPFRVHAINYFVAQDPWYYFLYALALIIFIALILFRNKLIRQNADIAALRLRKADKYARKRLKKSEGLLKQGNEAAFFEEVSGALWGYLSDKLNIPVASLSKDSAATALHKRNVDQVVTDRLFQIIDTCEMARFAQGATHIGMDQLFRETLEIITLLQQKLKSA